LATGRLRRQNSSSPSVSGSVMQRSPQPVRGLPREATPNTPADSTVGSHRRPCCRTSPNCRTCWVGSTEGRASQQVLTCLFGRQREAPRRSDHDPCWSWLALWSSPIRDLSSHNFSTSKREIMPLWPCDCFSRLAALPLVKSPRPHNRPVERHVFFQAHRHGAINVYLRTKGEFLMSPVTQLWGHRC
jgi:hypothetical protein